MSRFTRVLLLIALCVTLNSSLEALVKPQPYRAMGYSILFPGGGQIYNKQYLKAGIVIGVQGILVSTAINHYVKMNDYQEIADNDTDPFEQQLHQMQSDDYKDRLRSDYWWIGITMALSAIDAYVDAHLRDYDSEKERIHLKFDKDKVLITIPF